VVFMDNDILVFKSLARIFETEDFDYGCTISDSPIMPARRLTCASVRLACWHPVCHRKACWADPHDLSQDDPAAPLAMSPCPGVVKQQLQRHSFRVPSIAVLQVYASQPQVHCIATCEAPML